MRYNLVPTFSIYDLEEALSLQYGEKFWGDEDLGELLFGEKYYSDSYQSFWIGSDREHEELDDVNKCVYAFLKDIFPMHDYVLIDVSW